MLRVKDVLVAVDRQSLHPKVVMAEPAKEVGVPSGILSPGQGGCRPGNNVTQVLVLVLMLDMMRMPPHQSL